MESRQRIAFIGLGAMGARMARRLVQAGFDVSVTNRTVSAAERFAEEGGRAAASPADAAKGADVVIGMVTDDDASKAIWLDPRTGALATMSEGAIAVECSTVTPTWVRSLAEAAFGRGVGFVDAPVVGSRPQAEAGALVQLVGADAETLDRVRPALEAMCGVVHHVGSPGDGATLKLIVNAMLGIQVAAVSELLGFARRSGLPEGRTVEILSSLPVCSPATKGVAGLIAQRKFAPMFPIDLVAKDFGYVATAAQAAEASVPLSEATRKVFEAGQSAGHGGDNIHGVAKVYLDEGGDTTG